MLGMVVYSAAHTVMNALSRHLLFPLAGLGQYDYGILALRFPMEFFNDIASYWMWVLLLHLFYHYRESRDREVRTAQLESELTRAQLANLRAQLQPHFLFNTLNAISSHMYQDPSRADRMMTQLSDLLRKTFTSATQQKVILNEELEILRLYFAIMKGRFEERLEVVVHVDPECERALVPSMILQPLAENAIRHGTSRQSDVGRIDVSVRRNGGTLELAIADNGPGIDGDLESVCDRGLGIKNTVERLRRMYGETQAFELTNGAHGGATVLVKIPFEVPPGEEHAVVAGWSTAIHE
jgi:LytS/YehU family sensor histidine kinase